MLFKLQIQLKSLRQLQSSASKTLTNMTIGYYHAIPRYARLTDPGEKKVKKIHFHGEIIAIILASRPFHISANRENYYKRFP
jgi:hypothetical protein